MRTSYGYKTPSINVNGLKYYYWDTGHEARLRQFGRSYSRNSTPRQTQMKELGYAQSIESRYSLPIPGRWY